MNRAKNILSGLILICISLLLSCGEKINPVRNNDQGNGQIEVTYSNQIKPIFDNNCIRCHATDLQGSARNGAPPNVNFNSYSNAINSAGLANSRIQAGTMPPDGGLPSDDRDLFQQWIDQGLKE